MGIWFFLITLHFVSRISSLSAPRTDHADRSQLRGGNSGGTSTSILRGGPFPRIFQPPFISQHDKAITDEGASVVEIVNRYHDKNTTATTGIVHTATRKDSTVTFLTGQSLEPLDRIPFPQSIKNQPWETILHPAVIMRPGSTARNQDDDDGRKASSSQGPKLQVPPFWNPSHLKTDVREFLGNYGERLITPYEASLIGSRIPARTNYDVEVGDAEEELIYDDEEKMRRHVNHINYVVEELPPEKAVLLETIYVSISSYRDYRCTHTLEMLFRQAAYPERIRVGIVDQLDPDEDESCVKLKSKKDCEQDPTQTLCKYAHQIDVFEMDAKLAVGPMFARHIGHRMYRGEYFAMQMDAHMEFVNDWDEDLIAQWKSAKNEMAVITTYVSSVEKHYNQETGERDSEVRPYMCQTDFEEDEDHPELTFLMHGQQPEGKPSIEGEPLLIPFWAAGFSFARGHFVVQVPYDQYLPMIFQGEEISMGIRGFTYGYDFYAPEKSVLYHYYHTGPDNKKRKINRFWEHEDIYRGVENVSKARLLGLIDMLGAPVEPNDANGNEIDKDQQEQQQQKQQEEEEEDPKRQQPKDPTMKQDDDKEQQQQQKYEIIEVSWVSIDAKMYGTGKVRSVQKFLDTFGIDLKNMKVQKHLCRFVDAPMTKIFTKAIRTDKMGIDYDRITYQFKDPEEYGNTWEQYMTTM